MTECLTVADLIRAERLLPGSAAVVRNDRERTADVVRGVLRDIGMDGPVWADGPNGATFAPTLADHGRARGHADARYVSIASTLTTLKYQIAKLLPQYRVQEDDLRIVVRPRRSR